MHWKRREMLAAGASALLGAVTRSESAPDKPAPTGIVIHSYGIRRSSDKDAQLDDPIAFLEFCRSRGAGGVQTSLGVREDAYVDKLREALSKHKLYVEGSIALPRDKDDVERFTKEIQSAKRCGATVLRTVLMNGRRYE